MSICLRRFGRVAAVLVALVASLVIGVSNFDAATGRETYDKLNASFGEVWSVIHTRKPATMATWWQGWIDAGYDSCGALGTLFQNTIDYNTAPRIQPVPDVVIEEDESAIVDLKNYVDDAECSRDLMAFVLEDAGATAAPFTSSRPSISTVLLAASTSVTFFAGR